MNASTSIARRILGFALLIGLTTAALGDPVRFDGHKQIRMEVRSQDQWETLQSLTDDVWYPDMLSIDATWGVDVGPGRVEFRVTPEQFDRLSRSGLTFDVLDGNIQATIDAHKQAAAGGDPYQSWLNYDEVLTYLDNLAASRPDLAEIFTIGQTIEGRDITGIKITGPGENKPAVLYHACEHAREWLTIPVTLYTAEQLLTRYDDDPAIRDLVDRVEWYIIPVFNADGYVYTWTSNRFWRKNRRGGFGVDINRNWGEGWGGPGSSGDTGSDTYRGASPFSEPETQRLRDFFLTHPNLVAHNDIHSFGELALWPWGSSPDTIPDSEKFWTVGNGMVDTIHGVHGQNYTPGPVWDTLYPASGISIDWVYDELGILTYTFELRGPGFDPPTSTILPTCEEIFPALVFLTQFATTAVQIDFPDGLPELLQRDAENVMPIAITARSEQVDTDGAVLHYRIGGEGAFTAVPIAFLGGDAFEATFPARGCGDDTEYYVEARGTSGGVVFSPAGAPADVYAVPVGSLEIPLDDDFETDTGWSVENVDLTDGAWERAVPFGSGDRSPDEDFDGSGSCYVTGNRRFQDVDGGPTRLISPRLDLAGAESVTVDYARYFIGGEDDRLVVEVSGDDGGSWVLVEDNESDASGWVESGFVVGDFVTPTADVRVRFSVADNPNNSFCEAALDALRVVAETSCGQGGCVRDPAWQCDGDVDGDGQVNPVDSGLVQSAFGSADEQDMCNYDLDCDGQINPVDAGIVQSLFGTCETPRSVCP